MFIVDHGVDFDTPGHTTKLRAPYAVLVQLFGAPSKDIPEKCSTIWGLRDEADTQHVLVKDSQDEHDDSFNVKAFRAQPSYDWDVWTTNKAVATAFCRWLSTQVIAKVREVKTLTPERRAELNKLLAQGVPLADAMKRVPAEPPSDSAERFAWPIKT